MKKLIIMLASVTFMSTQILNAQQQYISQAPLAKYNFSAESVDPVGDSIAIEKLRHKMAAIRKTRPTVALVLSGGGAKGAAHVGVLKYFEEIGIPVDAIFGTSMGGLIGGLYALGHSAAELDTLVSNADWNLLLSDKVNPRKLSYSRKMYKNRYLLEIPFKYDPKDFNLDRAGNTIANIKLGAGDPRLTSSLPSGLITGLNVDEIFSSMSVDYHGDIDFTELPIPFVCVASDLVTGKAKNWSSGSIVNALRSTMSIPGMFTPVRTDGMVLMDGGTRNNFPTDLARAIGADIIIGVELSEKDKTFEEVNNIGDVVMQSITMLGGPAFEKNVGGTDVFIKPDLEEYNMLSFDTESIEDIINLGYEAAKSQSSALVWVKSQTKDAVQKYQAAAAKDMSKNEVLITAISFDGVYYDESRFLMDKLPFSVGAVVDGQKLKDALHAVYATGAFKDVKYQLIKSLDGYELCFDCVKGPIHRLGLGGRLDTQEFANVYLNLGINTYKITGSKFDFSLRMGRSFGAYFNYSLDLPKVPTLNFEASAYRPEFFLDAVDLRGELFAFWAFGAKAYISNLKATVFDWKMGIRYDYYTSSKVLYTIESFKEGFASAFVTGNLYTLDNNAFPTRGIDFGCGYKFAFVGHGPQYYGTMHILNVDLKKAFTLSPSVSLLLNFDARFHFTAADERTSVYTANYVGGDMRGRYYEQQVPFVGLINPMVLGDHFMALQLEPQWNIWHKLYASLQAGVLKDNDDFGQEFSTLNDIYYGGAVSVGYDTFMGPIKLSAGWNSLRYKWEVSASLGFNF